MGMKTSTINRFIPLSFLACLGLLGGLAATTLLRSQAVPAGLADDPSAPRYNSNGDLLFPSKYREWTYLSSGLDMNYSPKGASANTQSHSTFDNVFVSPGAYKAFLDSGSWPDKTVFVLELRGAQNKGSINQSGSYQGSALKGLEVHVKDEARFPGKWAFFNFENDVSGKLIPQSAACYSCHAAHGAVDTTFVQFYPTLLGIAEKKGTLSPAYLKELRAATSAR
jgi:Cytochrome P460